MKTPALMLAFALVASTPLGTGDEAAASPESGKGPSVDERLEEFVPTEEISADSAISFPVDI